MSGLTIWGHKPQMDTLRGQINRIWQEMDQALTSFLPMPGEQVLTRGEYMPPVELYVKDKDLVLKLDLPGFTQKDLQLMVDERQLFISGERQHEEKVDEDGYHRCERYYGKFARMIPLPFAVNFQKAAAKFDRGVLTVRMPLDEAVTAKSRRVEIQ